MKKLLFLAIMITAMSCKSQTKVNVDANGNYFSPKQEDKKTGKIYTDDKGETYDVYANSKGKLYVIRKSKKTGKEYRQYLKLQ